MSQLCKITIRHLMVKDNVNQIQNKLKEQLTFYPLMIKELNLVILSCVSLIMMNFYVFKFVEDILELFNTYIICEEITLTFHENNPGILKWLFEIRWMMMHHNISFYNTTFHNIFSQHFLFARDIPAQVHILHAAPCCSLFDIIVY